MSASDGDGDEITYSLAGDDENFVIDANTGQIDLIKTLDRETLHEARLEVWATDNGKSSLHVHLRRKMWDTWICGIALWGKRKCT